MNPKTLKYILKRLVLGVFTVWVVITLTFFIMHAVPGGPFLSEKAVSPAAQAAMEAKYGLDKPLMTQYVTYLTDVVQFRFGPSLKQRGRMVIDIITDGLHVSAKLGIIAAFLALIIGVVLGSVAALRRNTVLDRIIMIITTAFVSMPSFIMGSLLLVAFTIRVHWFPANGASAGGLVLPIITLMLYPMSYITRLTRSSMLDV
ncbi:MAG: ABC transporter permease, partial [Lachnospiraceae bacterium]|nr:ABC transporter permease [Lachnospiraceae bacterium]